METQTQPERKPFPTGLMVIAVVAALMGIGLAVLILSSNNAAQSGAVPVIPASSRALLREGLPAPQFTLNNFAGQPVTLEDLQGKPAMINFWASWCPPCLEETPALIEAYNDLKRDGVNAEFVGIGTNDDKANLVKFAENNAVPYIVVEDPDGKVSDAYGVRGMPTTVFLDSAGVVQKIWNGPIKKEQVIEIMRGLK
jgi:peroxiredoxin